MIGLNFFPLDGIYPFWANLARKIKIFSLSWNLVENSTLMFTFFCFKWKSFLINLVPNFKFDCLMWNLESGLIRICKFNGDVCFFYFRSEILILRNFGTKNQNCLFRLTFGTETTSNMRNLLVMLTFPVFDRRYFFSKLDPRN